MVIVSQSQPDALQRHGNANGADNVSDMSAPEFWDDEVHFSLAGDLRRIFTIHSLRMAQSRRVDN
jgi:hypothetical protein